MPLFITFPFTFAQDPNACEYLAEVVRLEMLTDERVAVAVRLLTTIYLQCWTRHSFMGTGDHFRRS
jgi:hypothetical protein